MKTFGQIFLALFLIGLVSCSNEQTEDQDLPFEGVARQIYNRTGLLPYWASSAPNRAERIAGAYIAQNNFRFGFSELVGGFQTNDEGYYEMSPELSYDFINEAAIARANYDWFIAEASASEGTDGDIMMYADFIGLSDVMSEEDILMSDKITQEQKVAALRAVNKECYAQTMKGLPAVKK